MLADYGPTDFQEYPLQRLDSEFEDSVDLHAIEDKEAQERPPTVLSLGGCPAIVVSRCT